MWFGTWPRVFFAGSLILVVAAYATWRLNWVFCHIYAGVALVALVIFRLLWGLFVSEPVRFSSFVTTPRVVIRNLIHLFQGEPDLWIGHNPVGPLDGHCAVGISARRGSGVYVNNDVANVGLQLNLLRHLSLILLRPCIKSLGRRCWPQSRYTLGGGLLDR